jgi:hypothetical protein
MGSAKRSHDLGLQLGRIDGLQAKLGNAPLPLRRTYARLRALSAEEGSNPFSVPGAALISPDTPGAGGEECLAYVLQRLGRNKDDQLSVHERTLHASRDGLLVYSA